MFEAEWSGEINGHFIYDDMYMDMQGWGEDEGFYYNRGRQSFPDKSIKHPQVIIETSYAYLICYRGNDVWFPKSQCRFNESDELVISGWIWEKKQKELIYNK